jgi:hypothetical protein
MVALSEAVRAVARRRPHWSEFEPVRASLTAAVWGRLQLLHKVRLGKHIKTSTVWREIKSIRVLHQYYQCELGFQSLKKLEWA